MRIPMSCGVMLLLAAACHKSPPPETPAPEPTAEEVAMQRHIQDSIDALNRFHADSIEKERQVAAALKARQDSLENARLAEERRVQDSLDQVAAADRRVQEELTSMVHFEVARSRIQPEDTAALARKVAILAANPAVRLKVTGAADERGSDGYNMALGRQRAAAIERYLVRQGVDRSRLETSSIGESSPVDPASTEAAWARNRRVEFEVLDATSPLAAPMALH